MGLQTKMWLLIALLFAILYGVITGIGSYLGAGGAGSEPACGANRPTTGRSAEGH